MASTEPPARVGSARRYRSPRREQQARRTRAQIITAAAGRFLDHGYAGTTMRAVAADAGVALPTVELAFGTKARLLKAVIDTAIAGDGEPVPMLAREWAERAESMIGAPEFAAAFARQLAASAQRAAGLTLVALEAARADADIAAVAAQLMSQREEMAAWLVDELRRRSRPRDSVDRDTAIDTVWSLMDPALFCRLTGDRHWSAARFRDWFADAVVRLLLPVDDTDAAGRAPEPSLPCRGMITQARSTTKLTTNPMNTTPLICSIRRRKDLRLIRWVSLDARRCCAPAARG